MSNAATPTAAVESAERPIFIYGTSNAGKLPFMRQALAPLELDLKAISDFDLSWPAVDENGNSPLDNARLKAIAYYQALYSQTGKKHPVFSCDSGLFLDGLPDSAQPGVHVRRVGGNNLTDGEMIVYYASLTRQLGGKARARYQNAICLVLDEDKIYEYMGEDIASDEFWLVSTPHQIRESGFPLDSLAVHIASGKYYNDLAIKPRNNSQTGVREFFRRVLEAKDE